MCLLLHLVIQWGGVIGKIIVKGLLVILVLLVLVMVCLFIVNDDLERTYVKVEHIFEEHPVRLNSQQLKKEKLEISSFMKCMSICYHRSISFTLYNRNRDIIYKTNKVSLSNKF